MIITQMHQEREGKWGQFVKRTRTYLEVMVWQICRLNNINELNKFPPHQLGNTVWRKVEEMQNAKLGMWGLTKNESHSHAFGSQFEIFVFSWLGSHWKYTASFVWIWSVTFFWWVTMISWHMSQRVTSLTTHQVTLCPIISEGRNATQHDVTWRDGTRLGGWKKQWETSVGVTWIPKITLEWASGRSQESSLQNGVVEWLLSWWRWALGYSVWRGSG